ncbi:MAG: PorP/SprF family type IX secretion system membrane protein, partial [Bacteroidota bacterium]
MRKIIYLLLNILIVENVFSQELILSNFYDNKAIFNPAFCGYQSGYRNIVLANRSFYRPNSGPFRYTSLAADLNLCAINDKIGIGLVAKNQTEGDGYLNMTSGLLQFSYTTAFGKRRRSKIGFGLQGGFNNYTIDWERLVFSDQLDAYQGNIYTSSNANAPWQSTYIPSISAGIIFYHNFKSRQSNQLWHVGLSVQNIFQPNTSLLLGNNYSPKRFI